MRSQQRHPRPMWLRLFAILSISLTLPVLSGCGTWTKARSRVAEDHRQLKEALAPLADPYGGPLSTRARDIEKDMAKSQASLR